MTLRTVLVSAAVLLCLPVAGCAGAHTAGTGPGSTRAPGGGQDYDAQARANRSRAEADARRLLALVDLPPGSVELSTAPAALAGPALGLPRSDTVVNLATYWRVPLAFAAVQDYLRQHPPAGLSEWGSSSAGSGGTTGTAGTTSGYGWAGTGTGSPAGQLEIGLAADAADGTSYLRADALTDWLDPHPLPDDATGRRLRLAAGDPCPAEDAGIVGVRNDGDGFDRSLLPAGTPRQGLLCSYAGGNGGYTLVRQQALPAAAAARLAEAAHRVDLGHANAITSCPADDGAATLLLLDYPNRPAADLWLRVAGCRSASNGSTRAVSSATLTALFQAVHEVGG